MSIQFPCDNCQTTLKVPDAKAGAQGVCPTCEAPLVVPDHSGTLSTDAGDEAPTSLDSSVADTVPLPSQVGRSTERYVYESKSALVWSTTVLMACYILSMLLYGAGTAYQLTLLNEVQAGQDIAQQTLENSEVFMAAPACGGALVILAIMVVWCYWKAGANRNARAISGHDLEYTPRWAAGSYFVPIANLVWPYQAMLEIWKNSDPKIPTWPVGLWWTLWIVNGIVSRIEWRLGFGAQTIDESITANQVGLLSAALAIVAAFAALTVVWKIQRMQEQAVAVTPRSEDLADWG